MLTATDRNELGALVFRAFLLRALVAIAIHISVPEEMFAPDQMAYHGIGASLVSYWSGESLFYHSKLNEPGPKGYFYIVGVLYYIFGTVSLIPKLVNAFIGSITVRVVHDLTIRVTGSISAARLASRYTAYFPSLVLWSALNIRDAWVILLIVVICREA